MTASKKAVRTRRGVEPAGRPARREVERKEKLPSKCFYSLLTIFSPAPPAAARPPRPSVVARPAVVDCCCTNAPSHAHRVVRVFYKTLPRRFRTMSTAS